MNNLGFESINNLIIRKRPIGESLDEIINQLLEVGGIIWIKVWILNRGDICQICNLVSKCLNHEKCFHLIASRGNVSFNESSEKFQRLPLELDIVKKIIDEKKPLSNYIGETSETNSLIDRKFIEDNKITSMISIPLIFGSDILGIISLYSKEKIEKEKFAWLKLFGSQASLAIANAFAFEEIENYRRNLQDQNIFLMKKLEERSESFSLIGKSPAWQHILEQINLVAESDATVIITGESGTGKEVVANEIQRKSTRRLMSFVKVNCAAISPDLFESEFFGHVKGSFTGAIKDRSGRFQLADKGTIFLDEISELPLPMQGKLLRVLQEMQFEKVGEDKTRMVNVRIIAATNKVLWDEVEKGNFRQDLYYRLSVFPIYIPPLRERIEDIEYLSEYFVTKFAEKMSCPPIRFTKKALALLKNYHFPGNVRELQNIIERAVILSKCDILDLSLQQILEKTVASIYEPTNNKEAENEIISYDKLKELEINNIKLALKKSKNKIFGQDGAARLLNIKPTTLLSKIKAFEIDKR